MGAVFLSERLHAKEPMAAKLELHDIIVGASESNPPPYSGDWGECSGVKLTSQRFKTTPEARDWLSANAQKWEEALIVWADDQQAYIAGAWCSQ